MWKYSHELEDTKDNSHSHLDQEMQYSMKIFRAQRNFYISGFALFLCLVLKRLVTLISAQATLQASHDAALKQAKSATDTAQKLLADKEKSEAAIGDSAQNQDNDIREAHEKQVKEVSKTLKETQEELYRSRADLRSMKQQAESVSTEYDRLLKEHTKLQEIVEGSRSKEE